MTPVVRLLLAANVLVFFLQATVLGAAQQLFAFIPVFALVRPWTIVTYMFLHGGFGHLLFNMIALFFFGSRVEERLTSRRFTILYFLSGITGALLSVFFSPGASIIGASGGVFGVMLAFAYFWPTERIYIWGVLPIQARVLVILTTIFALFSGLSGAQSGVAHFAHLGGYLGAYGYLKYLDRQRTSFRRKVAAPPKQATERIAKGWRAIDVSTVHEANRDEVNRILDKISAEGVGALTAQERTFLSNFAPPDDRPPPVA